MPAGFDFQGSGRDVYVIGACALLAFVVFCFDLLTPADNVSVGFAYVSVIALTFFVRYRRLYFSYAAVASVLIVVGCFYPLPTPAEALVFFANRLLAVVALWLTAAVIHYRTCAEAALIKTLETAELVSKAKSRFLASMSHELRAPLTGILGFSEILKNEMLGPIAVRRYVNYAGHIHESGERMLAVINDVLDIAKIESGRMEIDREWMSIETLFYFATDAVVDRARAKGMNMVVEAPPAAQLFADVRAAKQMLVNLVDNAVKFTPEGGSIFLRAEFTADGGAALSVRDTGVGMSHETLFRLSRPFEQADHCFSAMGKGGGLGLSLVKGLIGLHDGWMTIESMAGRGSTFTLHFPPPAAAAVRGAMPESLSA